MSELPTKLANVLENFTLVLPSARVKVSRLCRTINFSKDYFHQQNHYLEPSSNTRRGFTPAPQDKYKWSSQHHIMNITGNKFYDWKQIKGGGGAIDLVVAGIGRNVI